MGARKNGSMSNVIKNNLSSLDYKIITLWGCLVSIILIYSIYEISAIPYFKKFNISNQQKHKEATYIVRNCNRDDITTSKIKDLIVNNNDASDTQIILHHGAAVIPNLLSTYSTEKLREVIIRMNEGQSKAKQFFVMEHDHRWSLNMGIDDLKQDPNGIIKGALKEIADNQVFRRLLDDLLGPDAALVEMSAITSEAGAKSQKWHPDTNPESSSMLFSSLYSPIYTLFVPLQNTTKEMGATKICPGTHMCYTFETTLCDRYGIQLSPFSGGTGLLYNGDLKHRGMEHTAHNQPQRAMLLLSFVSRPSREDPRTFPAGPVFALRHDHYSHTVSDLSDIEYQTWSVWNALGFYKSGTSWGWPFPAIFLMQKQVEKAWPWHDYKFVRSVALLLVVLCSYCYYRSLQRGTFSFGDNSSEGQKRYVSRINDGITKVPVQSCHEQDSRRFRILATFHCIIVIISFIIFYIVWSLQWVQIVHNPTPVLQSNRSSLKISNKKKKRKSMKINEVDRFDVLLSDRLDGHYLYAHSKILNYAHPGNKVFSEILEEYEIKWDDKTIVNNKIIQTMLDDIRLNERRFLQQGKSGQWFVLDKEDIVSYLQSSELAVRRHKGSCGVSERYLSELLPDKPASRNLSRDGMEKEL